MKTKSEIHPKVWGEEHWIVNNDKYCGKILKLKRDHFSSLHHHPKKQETFLLLKGKVKFILNDNEIELNPGDVVNIRPGDVHKFHGLEDSEMIEFSTAHSENDVVRKTESGKLKDRN